MTEDWREWINSLEAPDLEEGDNAPEDEVIAEKAVQIKDKKFFLQKIMTECWVYTDLEGAQYGEVTFQDVVVVGQITGEKMLRMFRKKKKQSES